MGCFFISDQCTGEMAGWQSLAGRLLSRAIESGLKVKGADDDCGEPPAKDIPKEAFGRRAQRRMPTRNCSAPFRLEENRARDP